MKKYTYLSIIFALAIFGVATYVIGYSGEAPKYLIEGDMYVTEEAPAQQLGAFPGPDIYEPVNLYNTFTYGGPVLSTSTAIDGSTLLAREINNYQQIDMRYTGDGGADGIFTTTLPASTTLQHFLPEVGMCATRLFRNTHGTAASSTTITAGSGTILMEHTAAAETVSGGEDVMMIWCREANGSYIGDFTVKLEGWVNI
jgi:hypothetical protein